MSGIHKILPQLCNLAKLRSLAFLCLYHIKMGKNKRLVRGDLESDFEMGFGRGRRGAVGAVWLHCIVNKKSSDDRINGIG